MELFCPRKTDFCVENDLWIWKKTRTFLRIRRKTPKKRLFYFENVNFDSNFVISKVRRGKFWPKLFLAPVNFDPKFVISKVDVNFDGGGLEPMMHGQIRSKITEALMIILNTLSAGSCRALLKK